VQPPLFRTKPLPRSVESFKCPKHPLATPSIEACLSQEILRVHRALNGRIRYFWKLGIPNEVVRRHFVRAQRAWERYMRSECEVAYRSELGGTGAPVEFAVCELSLTRQYLRAVEFQVAEYDH
jgi:uncharacterized protein YecT (DUF1311 family)